VLNSKTTRRNGLEKLSTLVYILISIPIRAIQFFYPTQHHTWVFGAGNGQTFTDNSKHFYLFLLQTKINEKPVWITRNKQVLKEIRAIGGVAYHNLSLWGIHYILSAKYLVWSTSRSDVLFFNKKKTIINLWHGMPLKKIVYDYSGTSIKKTFLVSNLWSNWVVGFNHEDVAIIPSTSNFFTPFLQSAFRNQHIHTTGLPRNDVFFYHEQTDLKKQIGLQNNYIITYMPTHRKYGRGEQNPVIFVHNEKAERYFKDHQIKIVIKLHPNMAAPLKDLHQSSFILNGSDLVNDPQELLAMTDLLITDYSSCVFDFLLLNRPVIFYHYDNYEQVEENDLYFNIEEDLPGSLAHNESELFQEIQHVVSDETNYLDQRQQSAKLFNQFNDGLSSDRIYNLAKNRLDSDQGVEHS